MKLLIRFLAITFFLSGMIACDDDDDDGGTSPNTTYKATLTGASEVPPNASTATGTANLVYNENTKMFTLTMTYAGMTANAAHIHKGAVGVSGPPVFPLSNLTSPITYTSPALDATQQSDLKAGLYYVNIHSDAYPDGEIRGQLLKTTTTGGSGSGGGGGGGGY